MWFLMFRTVVNTVCIFKNLPSLLTLKYISDWAKFYLMQDLLFILCCISLLQVPAQTKGAQPKRSPIIKDGGTKLSPQQEEGGPEVLTTALKRRTEEWRRGKQRRWTCFPNYRKTHLVSRMTTKVTPTLRTVSLSSNDKVMKNYYFIPSNKNVAIWWRLMSLKPHAHKNQAHARNIRTQNSVQWKTFSQGRISASICNHNLRRDGPMKMFVLLGDYQSLCQWSNQTANQRHRDIRDCLFHPHLESLKSQHDVCGAAMSA